MIIYDFVIRGFICSLWAELPLPPPFSPILLLLLLEYGYCYVKVSFQCFLLEAQILLMKQIFYWLVINCLKFYWLLICWTPHPDPLT